MENFAGDTEFSIFSLKYQLSQAETCAHTEAEIKRRISERLDQSLADLPKMLSFLTVSQHLFARTHWSRLTRLDHPGIRSFQGGSVAIPFPAFHEGASN